MARVTVEDCVVQVPNRFDLVMLAAHRARGLASGAELLVDRDRDKNPVVALREIADMKLDLGGLEESLIKGLQKRIEPEQPEQDVVELMVGEQQSWIGGDAEEEAGEEGDDDFIDGDEEGDAPSAMSHGNHGDFEDADIKD